MFTLELKLRNRLAKRRMHALKLTFNDLREAQNHRRVHALLLELGNHLWQRDAKVLFACRMTDDVAFIIDTKIACPPIIDSIKLAGFLDLADIHRRLASLKEGRRKTRKLATLSPIYKQKINARCRRLRLYPKPT